MNELIFPFLIIFLSFIFCICFFIYVATNGRRNPFLIVVIPIIDIIIEFILAIKRFKKAFTKSTKKDWFKFVLILISILIILYIFAVFIMFVSLKNDVQDVCKNILKTDCNCEIKNNNYISCNNKILEFYLMNNSTNLVNKTTEDTK